MQKPVVISSIDECGLDAFLLNLPSIRPFVTQQNRVYLSPVPPHSEARTKYLFCLTDNEDANWLARERDAHDATQNFILLDKGSHFLLVPVAMSLIFFRNTYDLDVPHEILNVDNELKNNELLETRIVSRIAALTNGENDEKKRKTSHKVLEPKLAHDADVLLRYKKRKCEKDVDRRRAASSSLSINKIEKTEADWDFDDRVRSDDEDSPNASSDAESALSVAQLSSDEEDNYNLTSYGCKINRAAHEINEAAAESQLRGADDLADRDSVVQSSLRDKSATNREPRSDAPKAKHIANSQCSRVVTEDSIRTSLINYVRNNPKCELKSAILALNIDVSGSRIEIVRNIVRDNFDVTTLRNEDGSKTRQLTLREL